MSLQIGMPITYRTSNEHKPALLYSLADPPTLIFALVNPGTGAVTWGYVDSANRDDSLSSNNTWAPLKIAAATTSETVANFEGA